MDVNDYRIVRQTDYISKNQFVVMDKKGKYGEHDRLFLLSTCGHKCSPNKFNEDNHFTIKNIHGEIIKVVNNGYYYPTKVAINHNDIRCLLKDLLKNDINRFIEKDPQIGLDEFNKNIDYYIHFLSVLKSDINDRHESIVKDILGNNNG